jgi:hypothetical protein
MMTDAQLQAGIAANLDADSGYAVQFHLKDMIDRGDHGPNVSRYRFTYNGSPVTDFASLVNVIATTTIKIAPTRNHNRGELSVTVTFDGLVFNVNPRTEADLWFAEAYGIGDFRLGLDVAYVPGSNDFFEMRVVRILPKKIPT